MEKQYAIVGMGNAGGQVANLAEKKYPELFECIYINTSEADLSMINTSSEYKFKIGDKEEIEGAGKNRTKMKNYFHDAIPKILGDAKLQECFSTKKYIFVVSSAAGGTGSGAAPMFVKYLQMACRDAHIILIGILPNMNASMLEQGNTMEFLHEVYNILGESTTYMFYDNESTADLPPTEALEVVNDNIVEDLRVLTGVDNFSTPYESIDEADMENIITTPGRLLVTRITKGLTEKNMEDSDLSDIIIKNIKKSCHVETDRNKKVVRWGIITYFTDSVNRLYSAQLDKVQDFIGIPVERFNHNAINKSTENTNFMYLIFSGLSPINDRSVKIKNKIDEINNNLAKDETNKFIFADESYSTNETRKKFETKEVGPMDSFDGDAIFRMFMKD